MSRGLSSKVALGVALFSANSLMANAMGLLTTLILANSLDFQKYGLFVLIQSVLNIGYVMLDPGFTALMTSDLAAHMGDGREDRAGNVLRGFIRYELMVGVLLCGVLAWIGWWYGEFAELHWLLLGIAAVGTKVARNIALVLLQGFMRFNCIALMQAVEAVSRPLAAACAIGVVGSKVEGAVATMVVATMAGTAAVIRPTWSLLQSVLARTHSRESEFLRTLRGHGKWVFFQVALQKVTVSVPPWIVQSLAGTEAVALLSVARKIFGSVASLFPLDEVLLPVAARVSGGVERLNVILQRGTKYSLVAIMLIGGIVALLGPILIGIAFPAYGGAVPLLQILLLELPAVGVGLVQQPIYYAAKLQDRLFHTVVLKASMTAAIGITLTHAWGAAGMAIAYVVSNTTTVAVRHLVLLYAIPGLKMPPKSLFGLDTVDSKFLADLSRGVKRRLASIIPRSYS